MTTPIADLEAAKRSAEAIARSARWPWFWTVLCAILAATWLFSNCFVITYNSRRYGSIGIANGYFGWRSGFFVKAEGWNVERVEFTVAWILEPPIYGEGRALAIAIWPFFGVAMIGLMVSIALRFRRRRHLRAAQTS